MDRINKFLNARQEKNQKTIKYKDEKFIIKKQDLKVIRAYKSGKCLDPSIKSVPSRELTFSSEPAALVQRKPKKDVSEHFNRRLLEHYNKNPIVKVIETDKNEIRDIWQDEGLEDLKNHTQEWKYSITEQYEGKVKDLTFTKEFLEEEIKRVFMKYFRPRDSKLKPIRNILPKLPRLEQMRPYPEGESYEWKVEGKKFIFGSILCNIENNRLLVKNLKFNHLIIDQIFEESIIRLAHCENTLIASSKQNIYLKNINDLEPFKKVISSDKTIKDIYVDNTFIGFLNTKSIYLYDCISYKEVKILKLKGDTPHSIKICENVIYSSTHKGIMVDSEEKSEIKNLGYVIDFEIGEQAIYVINNLGRLLIVDLNLRIVGNTVQSGVGSQLRYHSEYNLLAILFTNEIGLYKIIENQCIPLNTISGSFKSIAWDEKMPWLYATQKGKVVLFT